MQNRNDKAGLKRKLEKQKMNRAKKGLITLDQQDYKLQTLPEGSVIAKGFALWVSQKKITTKRCLLVMYNGQILGEFAQRVTLEGRQWRKKRPSPQALTTDEKALDSITFKLQTYKTLHGNFPQALSELESITFPTQAQHNPRLPDSKSYNPSGQNSVNQIKPTTYTDRLSQHWQLQYVDVAPTLEYPAQLPIMQPWYTQLGSAPTTSAPPPDAQPILPPVSPIDSLIDFKAPASPTAPGVENLVDSFILPDEVVQSQEDKAFSLKVDSLALEADELFGAVPNSPPSQEEKAFSLKVDSLALEADKLFGTAPNSPLSTLSLFAQPTINSSQQPLSISNQSKSAK